MVTTRDEPSLGQLFSDLSRGMSTLVRQEVDLAKVEMSQKVGQVGKEVAYLAAGGFIGYAGFLAILAAVIVLLSAAFPLWASALIVGLVVAGTGLLLVWIGLHSLQKQELAPRQTMESIREDTEWLKQRVT